MNITFTVKHISEKYGLVYGTVRNHALQLFGRATGYFTEAEAQQIVQSIKPRVKNSVVQNRGSNDKSICTTEQKTSIERFLSLNIDKMDLFLTNWSSQPISVRMEILNKLTTATVSQRYPDIEHVQPSEHIAEDAYEKYGF